MVKKITMNQFDQLYYINLEYRKDMFDSINNVIDNLEFDRSKVTRIDAIKKDNGAYGCALSHVKALEDAKSNGYNKILILEDDFQPFDYEETKLKVTKFLNEVQDWDILMLCSNLDSFDICDIANVVKINNSQFTTAYAINGHFIDKLLEVFKESANMLSQIPKYEEPCLYCIDVNWNKIQKDNKWYAFRPILGREYSKFSDVQNRFIKHWVN